MRKSNSLWKGHVEFNYGFDMRTWALPVYIKYMPNIKMCGIEVLCFWFEICWM